VLVLAGRPVSIRWTAGLRDGARDAVAGADIRRREIHLHPALARRPSEYRRILTHELFHFVWVRLGNPKRAAWKELLRAELAAGSRGELGWSSEWRKAELPVRFDEYACESFCDSAAWTFAGAGSSAYTLAAKWRERRRTFLLGIAPFRY
jgi:hypothetical protein